MSALMRSPSRTSLLQSPAPPCVSKSLFKSPTDFNSYPLPISTPSMLNPRDNYLLRNPTTSPVISYPFGTATTPLSSPNISPSRTSQSLDDNNLQVQKLLNSCVSPTPSRENTSPTPNMLDSRLSPATSCFSPLNNVFSITFNFLRSISK